MITIDLLGGLAPFVQLVFIISIFVILFLVAYNRTAAINITTFLREIYDIYRLHRSYKRRNFIESLSVCDNEERRSAFAYEEDETNHLQETRSIYTMPQEKEQIPQFAESEKS